MVDVTNGVLPELAHTDFIDRTGHIERKEYKKVKLRDAGKGGREKGEGEYGERGKSIIKSSLQCTIYRFFPFPFSFQLMFAANTLGPPRFVHVRISRFCDRRILGKSFRKKRKKEKKEKKRKDYGLKHLFSQVSLIHY